MPTTFDNLTLQDVSNLIPPQPSVAADVVKMSAGDMWNAGGFWIGELPSNVAVQAKIQAGLVSENVILEMLDRHVGGVLGREPRWGFAQRVERRTARPRLAAARVSPGEQAVETEQQTQGAQRIADIEEALTAWWDDRNIIQLLQDVGARVLGEGRVPLRVLIPPGRRDASGQIPRCANLSDALGYIHIDTEPATQAVVHRDKKTRLDVGIYLYSEDGGNYAEVSYIGDDGRTVLRTIGKGDASDPIDLQRHLLHYDLKRKPLITEQIVQAQKALTLTLTQMMRNVNLAGSRERLLFNIKAPGEWVAAVESEVGAQETRPNSGVWKRFIPANILTGPGVTNVFMGEDVVNEKGEVIGTANPNVSVTDPVPTDTFESTRAMFRSAMYAQAQQSHALMSDDATASGKSRVEARAEYKSSLDITKTAIDDCGRWILEVVLYLAAVLQQQPGMYRDLRAEFGAVVDTGPLSSEEQQEIRANVEAGLLSEETAMSQLGVADVDAERERIDNERKKKQEMLGPVEQVNLQRSQQALERERGVDGDIQTRVAAALEEQQA